MSSFLAHHSKPKGGRSMAHADDSARANDSPIAREESHSSVEDPFSDSHAQSRASSRSGLPPPNNYQNEKNTNSDEIGVPARSPRRTLNHYVPPGISPPMQSDSVPSTLPPSPGSSPSTPPSEVHSLADLASFPPLTVNETTSKFAADAIDPKLIAKGKSKVARHKYIAIGCIFVANFMLIFSSWYWSKYYYIYLPFISLPLVLNSVMIFDIIVWSIKNLIFPPKKILPENPEEMVLLMPCYNETYEECSKSLDSLVNQINIGHHKKAIMVICDGKVRGPGMEKTTGDYLNQDIFVHRFERRIIRAAYVAWDGQSMDVEITRGIYKGIPYFNIVKQQNQGKRDSLIVIRSFVHNFNLRHNHPKVIFRPEFFLAMTNFLVKDAGMNHVELLIGMDADTVFAHDCITNLLEESHYPDTVGVCGYVAVDFSQSKWNMMAIYQSAEYTIAQGLRRLHQSLVTKKVSCLPGCCQLLRVCDETCGDFILIQEFGYHPKPTDGIITRIRATASEDRNHVCLMLMTYPHAKTRQALRANAYTDVPRNMSVFLSQRRRWTLGATSNDLMLLLKSNYKFNLWERIVALSNVLTWVLNFFVIASLACMIFAFLHQPFWLIMVFASVMIIPLLYYLSLVFWLTKTSLQRRQFLVGLAMFTLLGPFLNISVTLYAIIYMDNFGWGKTRKVIEETETGEAEEADAQAQHDRFEEAVLNNEKIVGTLVPDEENQMDPEVYMTPFTAPAGSRLTLPRADSEILQQNYRQPETGQHPPIHSTHHPQDFAVAQEPWIEQPPEMQQVPRSVPIHPTHITHMPHMPHIPHGFVSNATQTEED